MGIMGEACANIEAKGLERVITAAIKQGDPAVCVFVKNLIVPLYLSAKGEAWQDPDETLLEQLESVIR